MSSPPSTSVLKPTLSDPLTALGMLGSIPAEIRHQVYRYLLDTKFNRIDPAPVLKNPTDDDYDEDSDIDRYHAYLLGPSRLSRWYHFHTAILRANRAIYSEAAACMYKSNGFVLLEYCVPHFRNWLRLSHVPVVTDNIRSKTLASSSASPSLSQTALDGAVDFDHWCLKITFSWPTHWKTLWADSPTMRDSCDEGALVVAFQDLHILCDFLSGLCSSASPNCVCVDHPRRSGGWITTRPRKFVSFTVEDDVLPFELDGLPETTVEVRDEPSDMKKLRDTTTAQYRFLLPGEQAKVLNGIKSIMGIGYRLTTIGFASGNMALAKAVKEHTAPRIVWNAAMFYARLQFSLNHMNITRERYMMRKFGTHYEYSTCNRCLSSTWPLPHPQGGDNLGLEADLDRSQITKQKFTFKVDLGLNDVWACLSMEYYDGVTFRMRNEVNPVFTKLTAPSPGVRLDYYHMLAIDHMLDIIQFEDTTRLNDLRSTIQTIRSIDLNNEYISTDLPLLEQFQTEVEGGAVPSMANHRESIILKLSAFKGPRIFDNYSQMHPIENTEKFQRWQDLEKLEQMSEENKKEIEDFAAANGLMHPWRDDSSD